MFITDSITGDYQNIYNTVAEDDVVAEADTVTVNNTVAEAKTGATGVFSKVCPDADLIYNTTIFEY